MGVRLIRSNEDVARRDDVANQTDPTLDPGRPRGIQFLWTSSFSALLLCVLIAPVAQNWADRPQDGFPLSYYPMFTNPRGRTTKIHHAVAVLRTGETVNLSGKFAGPGGMNTQRRQMRKAVRSGRANHLARRIATGVASRGGGLAQSAVLVNVVESEYDLERYFDGDTEPVARRILGSAIVEGSTQR